MGRSSFYSELVSRNAFNVFLRYRATDWQTPKLALVSFLGSLGALSFGVSVFIHVDLAHADCPV